MLKVVNGSHHIYNLNYTKDKEYDNKAFDATQIGTALIQNGSFKPLTSSALDTTLFNSNHASNTAAPNVQYLHLFRFASCFDRIASISSVIFSLIASVLMPMGIILFGEFSQKLVDRVMRFNVQHTFLIKMFGGDRLIPNGTAAQHREALVDDAAAFAMAMCILVSIQFCFVAFSITLANMSAVRQIRRIRLLFFESILRQDMSWYDSNTGQNFAVQITDDLDKMKEGIGEKISIFANLVGCWLFPLIIAFLFGWKLTLVVLCGTPIIFSATTLAAYKQNSLTKQQSKAYSIAGSVANEVFTSIRTVMAFGGEQKDIKRFSEKLKPANKTGQLKGMYSGMGVGVMWFVIYLSYGLAFWYGIELVLEGREQLTTETEYTPKEIIIILMCVLVGIVHLGQATPHLEAFSEACGSANTIFAIIDRQPIIDSLGKSGLRLKSVNGDIEFKNIHFRYPARFDVAVLNGLNLKIKASNTIALVGLSGCGKSTCLQLLQRFYDPVSGTIEIDGVDIRDLNTASLRSFIGVVGQEPVLFATTIRENIRYGYMEATDLDIENAARIANCHELIAKLPNGYETMVGERGSHLSGGQKQRIAIARAVVGNPRILILDEATSSLDTHSERKVQDALEKASRGRTTLVVAHRLSTIRNADMIAFLNNGIVAETGTHEELLSRKGGYSNLWQTIYSAFPNGDPTTVLTNHYSLDDASSQSDSDNISVRLDDFEEKKATEKLSKIPGVLHLLKMNSPEWLLILIGCLGALVMGSSLPVFAVIFGDIFGIFAYTDSDFVRSEARKYAFYLVLLGIISGVAVFLQQYLLNLSGINLTSRLRVRVLTAMLEQEIGWFDEATNSVGALCYRLAADCANVEGATGSQIGFMLQAFSTLGIGILISFYYSWKLTIVTLFAVPLVLGAVFYEKRYAGTSAKNEKIAMEHASQIAIEAISNIRTVASLGQEPHVLTRYSTEVARINASRRRIVRLRGVVFALGQGIPLYAYAASLYYGGTLVASSDLEYKNIIIVSRALIFGTLVLGNSLAYAPDLSTALDSAARIMTILNRKPKMRQIPMSSTFEPPGIFNAVTFDNVEFRYPTRPSVQVLQGLTLNVKSGKTIALVGQSGCGKSTCIQLLLRYYDTDDGLITLDGMKISDMPLAQLRSYMGIVSQEPMLFDLTITENIAYGDNSRVVPMTEIIDAAKLANIYNFIVSLPQGFETVLGVNGTQLSGGQKQRIAIARALVRNPRILLLDEATSALDTQSEKIVQDALDRARAGRTCITIAHRLSTIVTADLICVIDEGRIVEKGTHSELMALGKRYANLCALQQVM